MVQNYQLRKLILNTSQNMCDTVPLVSALFMCGLFVSALYSLLGAHYLPGR